jgi:hypothetical protein
MNFCFDDTLTRQAFAVRSSEKINPWRRDKLQEEREGNNTSTVTTKVKHLDTDLGAYQSYLSQAIKLELKLFPLSVL